MGHVSKEVMKERLEEAAALVPLDSWYRHYKTNSIYRVIGHVILEKTDEAAVEYVDIAQPDIKFARELEDWLEPAEIDGQETQRFVRLPQL